MPDALHCGSPDGSTMFHVLNCVTSDVDKNESMRLTWSLKMHARLDETENVEGAKIRRSKKQRVCKNRQLKRRDMFNSAREIAASIIIIIIILFAQIN